MDEDEQILIKEEVGGEVGIFKNRHHVNITLENIVKPETYNQKEGNKFNYLLKNLPGEVRAIVNELINAEFFLAEFYDCFGCDRAVERNKTIKHVLQGMDKRLRKRLPKALGRPRGEPSEDEISEFLRECMLYLAFLDDKEKKLSTKNLADMFYPPDESQTIANPEKALGYRMKKYGVPMSRLIITYQRNRMTWKEVVRKYKMVPVDPISNFFREKEL